MSAPTEENATTGKITPEAIARYRLRLGVPVRTRVRPHNEVATTDSIRHFAHGVGDDNPLFCDPDYAGSTQWGGIIATPMFAMSMGIPAKVDWSEQQRAAMTGGDPLAGVGQYLCGERWLFARPITPGVRLTKSTALHSVEAKTSAFGGGRGALLVHRHVYRDEDGVPYVLNDRDFYHAERAASADAGKYRDIERTIYQPEDIDRIDAAYAAEQVRGAEPRYFEDVAIGDIMAPIVKGPMTVADVISYHIGWGWGMFGVAALKIGVRNRLRIPKFYPPNRYGIPEPAQRCHWEDDWAQELGQPAGYDYASMRMNWFAHMATNWAGDSGWLWKYSGRTTKFNYMGDTQWLTGRVTALRETASTAEADIEMEGVNQRGTRTCEATATILLPTRTRPIITIPEPDPSEIAFAKGLR
jgi:acyl dehydratase